jgi:hypothetical protein
MPARTFSKLASTTLVVSALGSGLSASALAGPATGDCACGGARVTLHTAKPVPQQGKSSENPQPAVRAPALRTSTAHRPEALPVDAAPAAPATDAGFQWADAAIGALGALGALGAALTGFGAVALVRRRGDAPDDVLPA